MSDPHAPAVQALTAADPVLGALIARVGPCRLPPLGGVPGVDLFSGLVQAIVSQQLSSKAASTIYGRVRALAADGDARLDARRLASAPEDALRGAGLSGAKARYVRAVAERVASGTLDLGAVAALEDEAVLSALTELPGIGRWTGEMVLMFRLGRPDVLPVDDLGIKKGFATLFGLRAHPTPERMTKLARPWRPWRSVACWYLWRLGEQADLAWLKPARAVARQLRA